MQNQTRKYRQYEQRRAFLRVVLLAVLRLLLPRPIACIYAATWILSQATWSISFLFVRIAELAIGSSHVSILQMASFTLFQLLPEEVKIKNY